VCLGRVKTAVTFAFTLYKAVVRPQPVYKKSYIFRNIKNIVKYKKLKNIKIKNLNITKILQKYVLV
jgi:hypothetical protein